MDILQSTAMEDVWESEFVYGSLDISVLQQVMSISQDWRRVGMSAVSRRIRRAVAHFVPHQHLDSFFEALDDRGSIIVGSVAQSVVAPAFFRDYPPRNLNVIAPWFVAERWVDLFRDMGFDLSSLPVAEHARPLVDTFYHGVVPGTITLAISNSNSALIPLFSSPYTSQINFISQHYVYCVYPEFTLAGLTLERPSVRPFPHSDMLQRRGISVFDPRTLPGPCPSYCSMEVRRTWTGQGIAMDSNKYVALNQIISRRLQDDLYDFAFLQLVGSLDRRLRIIVRELLATRIRAGVQRFLPYGHVEDFLNMLDKKGSMIGGSVAQSIITPSFFLDHPPQDLNVFVPWYSSDAWVIFFRGLGFILTDETHIEFRAGVESLYVARLPGYDVEITITVSASNSALGIVIASPYTCQMNFVTSHHVYCLYPQFTLKGLTIERSLVEPSSHSDQLQLRGLKVFDPRSLHGPCDIYCEMEMRQTWTGKGMAMAPWKAIPRNRSHEEKINFYVPKGVRALRFAARSHHVEPVFVPASKDISIVCSINDLDFSAWHKTGLDPGEVMLCLEDYRYTVRTFPFDSAVRLEYPFTVVWNRVRCPNVTIHNLSRGALTSEGGDILVVKHDSAGIPVDVEVEDKELIIRIVLKYVLRSLSLFNSC
ncbi:hypothetical protein CVT26_000340 [Gymnopilus dilepis]|uniref:Uncharacterized protein n=1 Tax=Gymnopilus dilepis TaxID=231916 RepID=A0A409VHH8_9AGAR|nr:hypothetical protein CVT26_000340 [Gymnopilus dilepis]